jgi:hypothetical protein
MGSRLYNPKLAKTLQCYRIEQVAELYGCHKNTVGNWLRDGLKAIDGARPMLVHGSALNDFHAARRAAVKRPCGLGELYCLPCRKPQRPAGNMAEHVALSASVGKLRAICPDCDRLLFQRVNARRLAVFRALLDVTEAKA